MRISGRSLTLPLALTLALAAPLLAQEEDAPKPDGWELRLDRMDRGGPDDVFFVDMEPGWHVTTGPATVLYHPDRTASGSYSVESEIFLFDPGERREGFGFFVGGQDLAGDGQAYTYFLIRRTGEYLVKRREGADTHVVQDWTAHDAIVSWDERGAEDATVKNVLSVEVGADDIAFFANGEELVRLPKDGLPTDGVVGLRVNHGLNLHVTSLEVEQG